MCLGGNGGLVLNKYMFLELRYHSSDLNNIYSLLGWHNVTSLSILSLFGAWETGLLSAWPYLIQYQDESA